MSSNKSRLRSVSGKKIKQKLQVTQLQSYSQTNDLKKSHAEMDYQFDNQSTMSYSKNNQQMDHFSKNPQKSSQVSYSNQSIMSNYSRPPSYKPSLNNNISMNAKSPLQSPSTDRIKQNYPPQYTPLNNGNLTDYQSVPTTNYINRPNHIQSFHQIRANNTSQKNLLNPQNQQNKYQSYTGRIIQPIQYGQIPSRNEPISQQINFMKNKPVYMNSLSIKQENDQLKEKNIKLHQELRIQRQKTLYQSKRLQQGSDQIKNLKAKLKQFQDKNQSHDGFFNPFEKRTIEIQNQRIHFQLLDQQKKNAQMQKIIKQNNIEKQNMKRQYQQLLRDKESSLKKNMDHMQKDLQLKNKELYEKSQQSRNLQQTVRFLENKCRSQGQIVKITKQNCQAQSKRRYQAQIMSLQNQIIQLQKEIQTRDRQKQSFANQIFMKLDNYMKPKGK